jgi:hypothetical protein
MGQAIKDVVGFGLAGVTGGASLLLGTERNENVSSPRLIERQESKKAEQTCMSPAPTRVGGSAAAEMAQPDIQTEEPPQPQPAPRRLSPLSEKREQALAARR